MFPAFTDINWLGLILAGVFCFMLGMLWYGPLFGKTWMKLSNLKKEDAKMENPGLTMSLAVLTSLLPAFALERLFAWSGTPTLHAIFGIALLSLIGFSGPKLMDNVLWGGQRWALFGFNMAYTLLNYFGMALIIFYV